MQVTKEGDLPTRFDEIKHTRHFPQVVEPKGQGQEGRVMLRLCKEQIFQAGHFWIYIVHLRHQMTESRGKAANSKSSDKIRYHHLLP